jgi:hypothetical protein
MPDKILTLEQIEAHIKSANLAQFEPKGEKLAAAPNPVDLLRSVCGVYRGIRPILNAILGFPLIPGSIKTAIRSFMKVMDTICA